MDDLMELSVGSFTTDMLVDGTRFSGDVTVDQEQIDITSEFEPDPGWVHVDSHGHEHRWVSAGESADRLPSLIEVDDDEPHWCEDCQGDYQPSHYQCRLCGDMVFPASRRTVGRRYMPGFKHLSIDVQGDVPMGLVSVRLLTDPPWVAPGRVVLRNISRSMDHDGLTCVSHIVCAGPPVAEETS